MRKCKPKRKYGKLTQQMILQRIREGTLLVCFDTMTVYSGLRPIKGGYKKVDLYPLKDCGYRGGRRREYRCLKIRYLKHQVTIPLHRLAWIAYNDQEIPDGCEIDHNDKNPENWHYSNLTLRTPEEHRARHANEDLPT